MGSLVGVAALGRKEALVVVSLARRLHLAQVSHLEAQLVQQAVRQV
jgi:hypothetical protein